jgi:hypothetical protein
VNRSFIDASGYADDVLRATHEFDKWHYVDWPDDSDDSKDQKCQPVCVLRALTEQIGLAKTSTDLEIRALALSWIIHLIGDMHQPLHVAERDNDSGGNYFWVTYKGLNTCGAVPFVVSGQLPLHKVWDDCLVRTLAQGKSPQQVADELRGPLTTYQGHTWASGSRRSWAKEVHILARTSVYADLDQNDDIGDDYIKNALPVVRDQLLKAGIRLARAVDEAM